MYTNKLLTALAATTMLMASCGSGETGQPDYTAYVNTFIGTADNGHTFPGACLPFGMVQASPETGAVGWRYCSGYNYADSLIWGFSQTHLNGTGCLDLGDVLIQPVTGRRVRNDYRSRFDKATESATPGYYTVRLDDYGVRAEMTATDNTAAYRFVYEDADSASLLIDLQHGMAWNEDQYHSHVLACRSEWTDDHTLEGHVISKVWAEQQLYFIMRLNRPVTDKFVLPKQEGERGDRWIASFDMTPGDTLEVRISLSAVDSQGASLNMKEQSDGKTFDALRLAAKDAWQDILSSIVIDGTEAQKESFYTAMYHLFVQPTDIADADGRYRGANDSVFKADGGRYFSTFSTWDTFRAAHPLYTIVAPDAVTGFVQTMIAHTDVQGYLPIWSLWGKETFTMIGNHAASVIAEAYEKGIRGYDAEEAYEAVRKSLTTSHIRSDWDVYDKYGYYPKDKVDAESVSRTLETCYDDYAAAVMAGALGKDDDARFFRDRSMNYKNLFDTTTMLMRPKLSDGSWLTPFNPFGLAHAESVGGDYTEGNAWQYTWHVMQDVEGLIGLYGGRETFLSQLDSLFIYDASLMGDGLSDVTGLIGLYAHGNEPSHHVAYLYALAGRPWRTQELVRELCDTKYINKPDGLCGNDDCGQMSAWYIFSMLGFYPVDPVSCEYVIGAPQVPEAVINLPGGGQFKVVAEGLSTDNKYVGGVTLNGEPYDKPYITHDDIVKGGTLVFKMTGSHE